MRHFLASVLFILGLSWLICPLAYADKDLGLTMPNYAHKESKHRYRSGKKLSKTVSFFKSKFRSAAHVTSFRAISLPGVKLVHFRNTRPDSDWSGVNISELKGKVYITVLPRLVKKTKQKPRS